MTVSQRIAALLDLEDRRERCRTVWWWVSAGELTADEFTSIVAVVALAVGYQEPPCGTSEPTTG